MNKHEVYKKWTSAWMQTVLFIILLVLAGYLAYLYREQSITVRQHVQSITTKDIEISTLQNEKKVLEEALYSEKEKNDSFEDRIKEIAGTVGILDKLSKTDPELLQKYSKVYFLNEHYEPSKLVKIDGELAYPENKELYIHASVSEYLTSMIEESEEDGLNIKIASAYRSFGTQADLKSSYKVTYGAGTANQFSADQGYSEHQLGTTVDFTTEKTGGSFNGFENTEEFKWLTNNAHRYGFILSYPKNNSYYQYEPWHWRFVGTDLARRLFKEKTSFYEMDQRTIDTYLVKIFD